MQEKMLHFKCGILLLTFSLLVGNLNAIPYYGNNFESDAEFVPLEHQQTRARNDDATEKPFEVDVITSDVGSDNTPNIYFQQSFPFFGPDFFNSFGGFGFGGGPQQQPWWKGPNVCTDKKEDVSDANAKEEVTTADPTADDTFDIDDVRPPLLGHFHFSVNSCIEKTNKYVCTRILNQNGKKKTITITRQCCHGYGRSRNQFATCEKIDIKNIDETAADMGAKEFVSIAKSNTGLADMLAKKNITIFMPLDNAFNSYNEQLQNENNLVETKSDEQMKSLYLRHIANGEISLDDVSNDDMIKTQQEGQSIRINTYQLPPALGSEPYRYTANCVPIEKHDQLTEQGLIHTLGGVMKPVTMTVMDIIRKRADMSIMRTVLETTKLHTILEGNKPVTVFVPTDDAFDKLEPHLRRALKEGKGCASNILKNHILDLTFCSVASVAGAKTTAYNLLGEPMRFNRSKTENSKEPQQPVIINNQAKILEADIMGTNGVLHVIDTILPTQSALPLSTLMQEKNVTLFKQLLELSGLDEKFDDMDNVTVFAPTDKALRTTKWATLLNDSPDQLRNNAELIDMLSYHVSTPMVKTCDLAEKLMPTINAEKSNLRVNLYSTHSLFSNVMNLATVNCAKLVHFDDESCGSVLHQVDKVLTPPKMNLLEMLESNPNYSKFLQLVQSANLTSLLSKTDDAYTLLVPKNEVFAEVEDWEKTLSKNQNELENLVKTHIVNDVVCCAGIIPTNWPFVRTIESLNGAHLNIKKDRRPMIANAGVTKCDNIAVNGLIHEINDVIFPQRRQQQQQPQPQFPQHIGFGDFF